MPQNGSSPFAKAPVNGVSMIQRVNKSSESNKARVPSIIRDYKRRYNNYWKWDIWHFD